MILFCFGSLLKKSMNKHIYFYPKLSNLRDYHIFISYILAVPGHALLWLSLVKRKRKRKKEKTKEHKNMSIFESKAVSTFQSNWWKNYGDLRLWRKHLVDSFHMNFIKIERPIRQVINKESTESTDYLVRIVTLPG